MAGDPVAFDEPMADRIIETVRRDERMRGAQFRVTTPVPHVEPKTARITSATTDDDGRYPAVITTYSAIADDTPADLNSGWSDYSAVKVESSSGAPLHVGIRYNVTPAGRNDDDEECYKTTDGNYALTVDGFHLNGMSTVTDYTGTPTTLKVCSNSRAGTGSISLPGGVENTATSGSTLVLGDQPSGLALTITGDTATADLAVASYDNPGTVSTGPQAFAGVKFFDFIYAQDIYAPIPGYMSDAGVIASVGDLGFHFNFAGAVTASLYDDTDPDSPGVVTSAAFSYALLSDVTASVLMGRGAGSGAGAAQEITLGGGLSMSGTTLSSSSTAPDFASVWKLGVGD